MKQVPEYALGLSHDGVVQISHELRRFLRATHQVCDDYNDVATASLIENRIDETERHTWCWKPACREYLQSEMCGPGM